MRQGMKGYSILPVMVFLVLLLLPLSEVTAGPYLSSAHGDGTYGVKRSATGFPADYPRGLCAHCHEQHASVDGSEPDPSTGNAAGPDQYLLFDDNATDQTTNFCYDCHKDTGSYQSGGAIVNRSYSYRAGGWTSDTLDDILEAFSFTSPGTSHNLSDISTFITGKWGYDSYSNPCVACHNPHSAQGDPLYAPNSAKSSTTRGWPVSRPSLHSKDNNSWGLWGDGTGEKMSDYVGALTYQAPYRYGSSTTYEPDGSTTQDGSNLTDFVTFCTDCHNSTNTIYSSTLGRNLRTIDWVTTGGDVSSSGDKHGKNAATSGIDVDAPYSSSSTGQYVLSCTDCHEPHGSPSVVLIRKEVNGTTLGTITTIAQPSSNDGNKELGYLCRRCHVDDYDYSGGTVNGWEYVHHLSSDRPYVQSGSCGVCHGSGLSPINCNYCHFHGSDDGWLSSPTGRRTF